MAAFLASWNLTWRLIMALAASEEKAIVDLFTSLKNVDIRYFHAGVLFHERVREGVDPEG
jgi:hypothetical protein